MRPKLRCMYVLYMQGTAESLRFPTSQAPCGVNGSDAAISNGMEGLGSGKYGCFDRPLYSTLLALIIHLDM